MIKLYNSLTEEKEEFKPINEKNIGIYSCGMTVYDKMHIGHARTTIFVDVLVRFLREIYKNVTYVRNITDVDDKINKRATERKITIQQLTEETIKSCNEDLDYIHNLTPTVEPRATHHIKEIIETIQKLIDNGHAYVANNHVFFDVNSYKDYGKLSNKKIEDLQSGARIEINDFKKNPLDFVLWKPSLDIDDDSSKFESPWGIGRPGWHIECSAMSCKYLGANFDIHCGGVDLKFPHHENEIAQSRCAFNSNFASYWFHVGALMVNGEKMSKSLGNFITIDDMRQNGVSGTTLRMMILKNHYRKPFDYKEVLVDEAEKNLYTLHKHLKDVNCEYKVPDEVIEALSDDLNTVKVIALLNQFNKNKEFDKLKNTLIFLGLFDESFIWNKEHGVLNISQEEIEKLIEERQQAKAEKNWTKADKIRNYLLENNIILKDGKDGCSWEIKQ